MPGLSDQHNSLSPLPLQTEHIFTNSVDSSRTTKQGNADFRVRSDRTQSQQWRRNLSSHPWLATPAVTYYPSFLSYRHAQSLHCNLPTLIHHIFFFFSRLLLEIGQALQLLACPSHRFLLYESLSELHWTDDLFVRLVKQTGTRQR